MWRNRATTLGCHHRWFAFQLNHVIRLASESASDASLDPFDSSHPAETPWMISSFAARLNHWKFYRHPHALARYFSPGYLAHMYVGLLHAELAIAFWECTRTYLAYVSMTNEWPSQKNDYQKKRRLQGPIMGLLVIFADSTILSENQRESISRVTSWLLCRVRMQ